MLQAKRTPHDIPPLAPLPPSNENISNPHFRHTLGLPVTMVNIPPFYEMFFDFLCPAPTPENYFELGEFSDLLLWRKKIFVGIYTLLKTSFYSLHF